MRIRFSDTRWLDVSIKVTGAAVVVAIAFLAYTMISTSIRERNSTPAARAAANLAEAVKENPDNPAARLRYADALAAAGRLREATQQYQEVLVLRPDDPQALAGLALLSMRQDEWRTAEGYWRKIVGLLEGGQYASVDQRLEKAYFYLGSTLMEVKEYEEAAQYLKSALRIRRDASDTYFLLAVAYREMGSDVKFRENLLLALQFDPELPEANYEYGKALLEDGNVAAAAEFFRKAADNAPPDRPEPLDALAKLGTVEEHTALARDLQAANDVAGAVDEARIAAAIDPENPDAVRLVAQLFEANGNTTAARDAFDLLLSLVPGDEEATAALARLEVDAE